VSSSFAAVRRFLAAPLLSSLGLLLWSARLAGVLLVLHALGGRAATTVLSGTLGHPASMFLGVSYTLTYFVCAAFTPPLLAAAALTAAVQRLFRVRPAAIGVREQVDVC
jgi:hypothetical protein